MQPQCANITFSDKSRYNILFQKVIHKGGESSINYNKIFQNDRSLEISVVNCYSEDQLMHTFYKNFQKCGKYSSQIASHQAELRIEEKMVDQKSLSISDLKIDYLNLENSVRNNGRDFFSIKVKSLWRFTPN